MAALAALVEGGFGKRREGGPMSPLRGSGVSPGIAVGRALVMERDAAPIFRLACPGPGRGRGPAPRGGDRGVAGAAAGIKERLSREVGAPTPTSSTPTS